MMIRLITYRVLFYFTILALFSGPVMVMMVEANSFYSSDPMEGRYSFSLTTFHPSGKLPQLSHAIKASTIGPPILAIHDNHSESVVLASLQTLPSPLMKDDGTARFIQVTDSILMGHTGINADGRVVCEAAQRLAVEHAYTFEEEIPMSVLLEEMSLLFQEYTMKAGVRPFGCAVILASPGNGSDNDNGGGGLYRIDPSGAVTKIDQIASMGRMDNEDGILKEIAEKLKDSGTGSDVEINIENILKQALREVHAHNSESRFRAGVENNPEISVPYICAKVTRGQGASITRRWL